MSSYIVSTSVGRVWFNSHELSTSSNAVWLKAYATCQNHASCRYHLKTAKRPEAEEPFTVSVEKYQRQIQIHEKLFGNVAENYKT